MQLIIRQDRKVKRFPWSKPRIVREVFTVECDEPKTVRLGMLAAYDLAVCTADGVGEIFLNAQDVRDIAAAYNAQKA